MRCMKKLASSLIATALSASLLATPVASAAENRAEGSSASSSSNSVTRNKDNADAIPDGFELPEQPAFGSAYTGSAPVSILLTLGATAAVLGVIAQYPPVAKAVEKYRAQWAKLQRQFLPELR